MKQECKSILEEWDVIQWCRESEQFYAKYVLLEKDEEHWWLVGLIYSGKMVKESYQKNIMQELLDLGTIKVVQELKDSHTPF